MKITEIQIKNFGKLHNINMRPLPGLNVIYGENEAGKSTMQRFITSMLFGLEKQQDGSGKSDNYQKYEPWNSNSFFAGGLKFTVGEKPFYLERNFYHEEKSVRLTNEMDGEELSVEHGDLEMLLGGMKKASYENTYCIHQAEIETKEEFAEILQNYFVNMSMGGEGDVDLAGARNQLKDRQKEAEESLAKQKAAREDAVEKLRVEEDLLQRDIEQLQEQQEESLKTIIRQRPDMSMAPPEHDGNQMAEYLWDIRQKKRQKGYRARLMLSLCVTLASLALGIVNFTSHSLSGAGSWFYMILELILLFGFLGGAGSVCHWLQKEKKLKSIIRQQEEAKKERNISLTKDMEWQKVQERKETKAKHRAVEELLQEQLAEKQSLLLNLQEEIEEVLEPSEEEQELALQVQAYELAYDTLQNLSKDVYQDTRKQMEKEMSGILAEMTQGKYDRIGLDEQMKLAVEKDNRSLQPWQLSQGVMEQMYVALRMGAGGIFTQEESMPIILDEVFASFDEKRLESALKWLGKQKGQIFLFTCQRREMEILERNHIPYGKILLSR
ncbi:MAG: AAA family ATPase [Lachnospiraceae bacterium]|nr:AAA family ATPase [Lachnospiraceae bacterium]